MAPWMGPGGAGSPGSAATFPAPSGSSQPSYRLPMPVGGSAAPAVPGNGRPWPPFPGPPGAAPVEPSPAPAPSAGPQSIEDQILWTPGEVNQLANQKINQLDVGQQDALSQLQAQLAGTGAAGSLAEKTVDLSANTAAQSAAARSQAALDAKEANAKNLLEKRSQDIGLSSDAARNQLNWELGKLGASTATRGQDIGLTADQLASATAARGQDVTQRGQDVEQSLTGRNQDINTLDDLLRYYSAGRGQDAAANQTGLDAMLRGLGLQVEQRGQDIGGQNALAGLLSSNYFKGADLSQQNYWNQIAELDRLLNRLPAGGQGWNVSGG